MSTASTPSGSQYDAGAAAAVISRAVDSPGGPGMVVAVMASLPAAGHTPARKGRFRSSPEQVQLGSWRYQVGADGRLQASHVVGGIVLAEQALSPDTAGEHVAAAIAEHIAGHGSQVRPYVESMLTVLDVTAG
jgi:hypothetical protein